MAEVEKVLAFRAAGIAFETETDLVGGSAYDAHGAADQRGGMARARAADAVLLGAVGGPKWAGVPFDARPEAGLFACARISACSPICARRSAIRRSPTRRR